MSEETTITRRQYEALELLRDPPSILRSRLFAAAVALAAGYLLGRLRR